MAGELNQVTEKSNSVCARISAATINSLGTRMTNVKTYRQIKLFGISIAAVKMNQVIDLINKTIVERGRLQIGVVNAAKMVNIRRDPVLRDDVISSDIILADGSAVVFASRLLGRGLPERVAGIDIMVQVLERGNREGYRVYLLGATEEVSFRVAQEINHRYPGIKLVGRRNGYFSETEEQNIAEDIAQSAPDVLFVAITSPKKEKFLARWSERIGVPVCHGVGGSFDVMAGKVQRAPLAWQQLGLEWLYRLKQEPRRMLKRYLVTNTLFCLLVLRELSAMFNARRDAA